jgi:dimethylargininase
MESTEDRAVIALTRAVSPNLDQCELTHAERQPIDVGRARAQHEAYEAALSELGCVIERVAPAPGFPDAVFVEDTAIVVPEVAVLARPGAVSRRGEVPSVAEALARHRAIERIEAPGTLDGGDVLRLGRQIWVGASERTNAEGAAQLRATLEPHGYRVRQVRVAGCLHLKTAVSAAADDTLLIHPEWVDRTEFGAVRLIQVDPAEPNAANVLRVGDTVVIPASHPRTRARLEQHRIPTRVVEVSELAKAEAGVTCCSILID